MNEIISAFKDFVDDIKDLFFPTSQTRPTLSRFIKRPRRYYHAEYEDYSTRVHSITVEKVLQNSNDKEFKN